MVSHSYLERVFPAAVGDIDLNRRPQGLLALSDHVLQLLVKGGHADVRVALLHLATCCQPLGLGIESRTGVDPIGPASRHGRRAVSTMMAPPGRRVGRRRHDGVSASAALLIGRQRGRRGSDRRRRVGLDGDPAGRRWLGHKGRLEGRKRGR